MKSLNSLSKQLLAALVLVLSASVFMAGCKKNDQALQRMTLKA